MERCAGRGYIGRRGANLRVAVQRLGKLLRDHRLLRRGADGSAIRGGRPRRRGALDRPGGGRLRHAHGHPLLRRAARVGDPERAVARGLERRARAGRRGCGGHRVHGGRHKARALDPPCRTSALLPREANSVVPQLSGGFPLMTKHLAFIALVAAATPACEQNRGISNPAASFETSLEAQHVLGAVEGWRAVYTLTNQVAGNAVAVFNRAADGTLSAAGTIATGGTGTGGSLGSQGAVALSDDGRRLFAVNAGSNDVSVFDVGPTGLSLASQTASGGTLPISLTAHGSLLYVLNAGGAGNISGFSVGAIGGLTPIAGSTQPLSGTNVGPAQVSFSPDGRRLVVTEKNTNLLDVYAVDANGAASGRASVASAGGTPFGFAFGHRNDVFVSEATGSASSYVLDAGNLSLVSGADT